MCRIFQSIFNAREQERMILPPPSVRLVPRVEYQWRGGGPRGIFLWCGFVVWWSRQRETKDREKTREKIFSWNRGHS